MLLKVNDFSASGKIRGKKLKFSKEIPLPVVVFALTLFFLRRFLGNAFSAWLVFYGLVV